MKNDRYNSMLPLLMSMMLMDDTMPPVNEPKRPDHFGHVCKQCGIPFKPVSSNKAVYCSAECYKQAIKGSNQ